MVPILGTRSRHVILDIINHYLSLLLSSSILKFDIIYIILYLFWDIIHYACHIQILFILIRHYLSKLIWIYAGSATFSLDMPLFIFGYFRTQPGPQSVTSLYPNGSNSLFCWNFFTFWDTIGYLFIFQGTYFQCFRITRRMSIQSAYKQRRVNLICHWWANSCTVIFCCEIFFL